MAAAESSSPTPGRRLDRHAAQLPAAHPEVITPVPAEVAPCGALPPDTVKAVDDRRASSTR
jgi:hypothetical protein